VKLSPTVTVKGCCTRGRCTADLGVEDCVAFFEGGLRFTQGCRDVLLILRKDTGDLIEQFAKKIGCSTRSHALGDRLAHLQIT
jgi:hypothetical protein